MDEELEKTSILSVDSDCEGGSKEWKTTKASKFKKQKSKRVVVASRSSSRIPRDGIPIAEKAARRTMEKNGLSGKTNSNPFPVVNNTEYAILQNVMRDLGLESEDLGEQLDDFRSDELARAAIAEANYKNYLEC